MRSAVVFLAVAMFISDDAGFNYFFSILGIIAMLIPLSMLTHRYIEGRYGFSRAAYPAAARDHRRTAVNQTGTSRGAKSHASNSPAIKAFRFSGARSRRLEIRRTSGKAGGRLLFAASTWTAVSKPAFSIT